MKNLGEWIQMRICIGGLLLFMPFKRFRLQGWNDYRNHMFAVSGVFGKIGLMRFMMHLGAQIEDGTYYTGSTALMCASEAGQITTVKWLVNQGASVNAGTITKIQL